MKIRYTLKDLRDMDQDTITPQIAGDVLGCCGATLGLMAHQDPDSLPFPVLCIGNRTVIPREGFIAFMEGKLKLDAGQFELLRLRGAEG